MADSLGHASMFGRMPKDAYGNEYELGGYILSPKYGIARVVGVAVGEDGSACVVGSYAQPDLDDPYPGKPAKWRTWLFRAKSNIAVELVDGRPATMFDEPDAAEAAVLQREAVSIERP